MPKKHVYAKDTTGFGDFVYVDLLPDVRRARQFNMRVIIALLITISFTFVLIYLPYSSATFELEDISSDNNDLQHELTLVNEEFTGNEIDLDAIAFQKDIDAISNLKTDYNDLYDYLFILVDLNDGRIKDAYFNMESAEIVITVSMVNNYRFNTLNNQILNLSWVVDSSYTDPVQYGDDIEYKGTFTIEVNLDAE